MAKETDYTLEDVLTLSNEELTSAWSKLASLITRYEKIEWEEAKYKAIDLLRFKKATDYINQVRDIVSGKAQAPTEEPTPAMTPEKPAERKQPEPKKKTARKTGGYVDIYERNYAKLLKVVPDLEQRLLSGQEVYGKSSHTGYMDFNLELIHKDKTGYYLALSHYYVQNGDMVADPDMVVLVNLENRTLIPLSYQNSIKYVETYDDIYDRKMVNTTELKSQSSFLGMWLSNLRKQGHVIEWKEDDSTGNPPKGASKPQTQRASKVIDEYAPKEETAPERAENPEVENIVGHWKRLSKFIREYEGVEMEEADKTALELTRNGKAWDYVENALSKKDQKTRDAIFHANYNALLSLIPDLQKHYKDDSLQGSLHSSKNTAHKPYEVSYSKPLNPQINSIAIFDNVKSQNGWGFVVLTIHRSKKRVWVIRVENGFFKLPDYDISHLNAQQLESENQTELIKINERFGRFLNLLIDKGYKNKWLHIQTEKDKRRKAEAEVNKEIPDFEPGHVELTEAHKRAGLTQKHIDWINENQQGMVITPRRNMVNKTKDFFADQSVQAKRPGFRVSRTGKLYYEGRSNRSDLTDSGL